MPFDRLLRRAIEVGASDLHLKAGSQPTVRIHGRLQPLSDEPKLDAGVIEGIARSLLSERLGDEFARMRQVDLAHSLDGVARFRVNVFQQRGTIGIVVRLIPPVIRTIEELGLPPVLRTIAGEERGLVVVTGTAGSGKSTTLASIIHHINQVRAAHVITIEDPVEYVHTDQRSVINQREVGSDTPSFSSALRAALRQDPDVILVGEMRDVETVETALHAAETGHLVLSTLHTLDAIETINRIIAMFPSAQQDQIRLQLSVLLRAAVAQRLIPRADGLGRVPAVEVMLSTAMIRSCIADKTKTHLIQESIVQGTSQYGMQSFDQSIFNLYSRSLISYDEALGWATSQDEFKLKVQGVSTTADAAREQMARKVLPSERREPRTGPPEITRFGR
jgi:twitching motility protein PilT